MLRISDQVSYDDKMKQLDEVIDALGLKNCLDTSWSHFFFIMNTIYDHNYHYQVHFCLKKNGESLKAV